MSKIKRKVVSTDSRVVKKVKTKQISKTHPTKQSTIIEKPKTTRDKENGSDTSDSFKGLESNNEYAASDTSDSFKGLESDNEYEVDMEMDEDETEEVPLPMQQTEKNISNSVVVGKALAPSSSSKEAHAQQKVLVQERKAAKPNADVLQRSKKLWEQLRRKSHVPLEERKKLVAELFEIVTGRVKDFVLKHDAVRVIQTAIKYANLKQRKMIAVELKGAYVELAKARYAKHLIGKILVHGDDEVRDMVIPEFYGQVRRLIKHPEASWILDDIYRGAATPRQKAILLREWYGPEFAIFKNVEGSDITSKLETIITTNPEKRAPIMRSLHELINGLVQKQFVGFTMLHDAMLEYYTNVKSGSDEASEFLELLKGDESGNLLKNLAFTKSGAKLVCFALAAGNAKDRKVILKAFKQNATDDTILQLATDPNGHQIILAAYEVIDDTVLTSKRIFPELLCKNPSEDEKTLQLVLHPTGRISLLYLLAGRVKWLLPNDDINILQTLDQMRIATSKKDSETRRRELSKELISELVKTVATQMDKLCLNALGCQFITEVLLNSKGDKETVLVLHKLAGMAEGDPTSEGHMAKETWTGKMLKTLVLGGRYSVDEKKIEYIEPPLNFHNILYEHIKPHIVQWATGPSSFVVVNMLDAKGFQHSKPLLATLGSNQEALKEAAESKAVSSKVNEKRKIANKGVENKGARELLEKLK
ncbi:MAG: pumilio domain member 6 [Vezdaea acicularis]|nr:MAG: pumilio domain member 6 [Vezdaea acicularis]